MAGRALTHSKKYNESRQTTGRRRSEGSSEARSSALRPSTARSWSSCCPPATRGTGGGRSGNGREKRARSREPPRAESSGSFLLRQERHGPRREARREAAGDRLSDVAGARAERQVRDDDDLVLEEVRPLGDLVEVEVLPFLLAFAVALLDERALEEEHLRREERARRAREDPGARVARVGDERNRDLLRHGLAARRGVTDLSREMSREILAQAVADLGCDEA